MPKKKQEPLTAQRFADAVNSKSRSEIIKLLSMEQMRAMSDDNKTNDPKFRNAFQKAKHERRELQKSIIKDIRNLRKELTPPKSAGLKSEFGRVDVKFQSRRQKKLRELIREKRKELKATKIEMTSKKEIEELRQKTNSPKMVLVPTPLGTTSIEIRNQEDAKTFEKLEKKEAQLEIRKNQLLSDFKATSIKKGKGLGMAILLTITLILG